MNSGNALVCSSYAQFIATVRRRSEMNRWQMQALYQAFRTKSDEWNVPICPKFILPWWPFYDHNLFYYLHMLQGWVFIDWKEASTVQIEWISWHITCFLKWGMSKWNPETRPVLLNQGDFHVELWYLTQNSLAEMIVSIKPWMIIQWISLHLYGRK